MKVFLRREITSRLAGPAGRVTPLAGPRRGQAMIEFALVLPVMLLIVLGAVDVGRVFFDYVGLRNAAMAGAIYGARNPSASSEDIKDRVHDHYGPSGLPDDATIPVANADSSCNTVSGTGFVTVTIRRDFRPITLDLLQFAGPGTDWEFTVNPTAKARCMT